MLLKVISCDALRREICAAAARSPNRADLEFLPAGYEEGTAVVQRLQDAIDRASEGAHDAIVLAYALCGNSVAGIESRGVPLVIPRPIECAPPHAGKRAVCFQSTGWKQSGDAAETACAARYTTYRQVMYVTTSEGGEPERHAAFEYRLLRDRHDVFDQLLSGNWPEADFLLVPQGWRVAQAPGGQGIDREPIA